MVGPGRLPVSGTRPTGEFLDPNGGGAGRREAGKWRGGREGQPASAAVSTRCLRT